MRIMRGLTTGMLILFPFIAMLFAVCGRYIVRDTRAEHQMARGSISIVAMAPAPSSLPHERVQRR